MSRNSSGRALSPPKKPQQHSEKPAKKHWARGKASSILPAHLIPPLPPSPASQSFWHFPGARFGFSPPRTRRLMNGGSWEQDAGLRLPVGARWYRKYQGALCEVHAHCSGPETNAK